MLIVFTDTLIDNISIINLQPGNKWNIEQMKRETFCECTMVKLSQKARIVLSSISLNWKLLYLKLFNWFPWVVNCEEENASTTVSDKTLFSCVLGTLESCLGGSVLVLRLWRVDLDLDTISLPPARSIFLSDNPDSCNLNLLLFLKYNKHFRINRKAQTTNKTKRISNTKSKYKNKTYAKASKKPIR